MHENDGPDLRGDPPEAAAREFRSLLAASGSLQGPGGADPDIISQLRGLETWAITRGELAPGRWLTTAVRSGAEHSIQCSQESERLIKVTHPSQYGLRMRIVLPKGRMPVRLNEAIALGPASPLQYLDRLTMSNRLFGDDVEFLGLVRVKGGLSIVTSQIFLRGEKPSIGQIQSFMSEHGFRKLAGENAYYRPDDRLAVFDAHARNFVFADGVPVPFDVIPQLADARMDAILGIFL